MRKSNLIVALLLVLILGVCLVACGEETVKITVTFDTQGGSDVAPIIVETGKEITLPENPTKEGYIFDGWYIDKDLLDEFIATQTIAENITLYAKWACDHTPVTDAKVDADCENTGLTEGSHCSKCNDVLVEQQIVPAKGHSYGEWIDEISADCENAGTKGHYECSVCHNYFDADHNVISDLTIVVDDDAHDLMPHAAKVPTCAEVGWEAYYTCSRCDYSTYQEIPANGHNYGTWINEVPATCVSVGTKGHYECSACHKYFDAEYNEIQDITISAGHKYDGDGVCENCGYFETGLAFALNSDGESWSVTSIGTFSGTDLRIPAANYDGKPIANIAGWAFLFHAELRSITIPDSVTLSLIHI